MCKIKLSESAYANKYLYLNTLILNQRKKPFTEKTIISIVESEGIEPAVVRDALNCLIHKGLVSRIEDKYYVRPFCRKKRFKVASRYLAPVKEKSSV